MRWGIEASAPVGYSVLVTPASSVTSDLYFDLSLLTVFWTKVRSDGGDIRVFKQDGVTPVAREVCGFDYANKLGSLFLATSSATAFYITCGTGAAEPAANSTYGKYAVWETAVKVVAHGEDYTDSTGQNTLTAGTETIATAKVGSGFSCAPGGLFTKVDTTYDDELTDFTFLAWFNASGVPVVPYERIVDKNFATGICLCRGAAAAGSWGAYFMGLNAHLVTLADGAWHLLVVTRSGTTLVVNGDGGAVTNTSTVVGTAISADILRIGWAGVSPGNYCALNGMVDEVRIYNRALSATEIATMYANQNDPGTFWTTGAET